MNILSIYLAHFGEDDCETSVMAWVRIDRRPPPEGTDWEVLETDPAGFEDWADAQIMLDPGRLDDG